MAIGIKIGVPFGGITEINPVAQAPVNTNPPFISPNGNVVIGTLFTSNNGSWYATRPLTFEYRWTRNGTPIGGATSQTYTSVTADEGQTLRCEVKATNAFGTSAYIASSNSATGVTLPVNTVAPAISGSTTLGSVLTTTNGTWTGTATITFTYQWKRGGVSIGGATASTYTLVAADSSANITCVVTGTNVAGSASATSNTIAASNFNPVNTVAPTLSPSGTQSTGTVITLGNGTWTGATPITYEYRWLRDNVVITGQTSSTYTILAGDDTKVIKGQVRATNSLSTSAYVTTSNQVDAVDMDADAKAYFDAVAAAGGTLSGTEKSAYNTFVLAAKANGYYSKFKALYPMLGASATACKFNAIDPRDLDAAYRLTFSGGITYASTGITGNGTNGYGNTNYVRQTADRNDFGISFYSRNVPSGGGYPGDIGVNSPAKYSFIILGGSPIYAINAGGNNHPGSTSSGLYAANRISSTEQKMYVNGINTDTQITASTMVDSEPIYLLALNTSGSPSNYGNKECAFASINASLNATEHSNFYTDLQAFQTTLSRQV